MSRPKSTDLVTKVYRRLLIVYPAAFRREVGADIAAAFSDRWQVEGSRGFAARTHIALQTAWDLLSNGLLERMASIRIALGMQRLAPSDSPNANHVRHTGKDFMEPLSRDLKTAIRSLGRAPGFTAIIILTLAIGIGANTAIFSVVNAVVLRPLPFPNADELVIAWGSHPEIGLETASYPDFVDWREQSTSFQELSAAVRTSRNLTGEGFEAERVRTALVTRGFFRTMGVAPILGRAPTDAETDVGAEPVVVLSHGVWQRRYGGDQAVLDRSIDIQGVSHRIVGVAPPAFDFPQRADLWVPFARDVNDFGRRGDFLRVYGRLKPGITIESAQTEMSQIMSRLEEEYPATNTNWSVQLVGLHEETVGDVRPMLILFLAAVGFVLLIVCTNVANLMLARATARTNELALRSALGAGRGTLVRQLFTESAVLALIGGSLGVFVAYAGVQALIIASPGNVPRLDEVGLDGTALIFALGVSLATGLLFGISPALHAASTDAIGALQQSSQRTTAGRRSLRVRSALIIGEVAVAVVLLVGAGLLMRSFVRLQAQDPGFESSNITSMRVSLPSAAYPDSMTTLGFYRDVKEEIEALPGVQRVTITSDLPMEAGNFLSFAVQGQPVLAPGEGPLQDAVVSVAGQDYFNAVSIPVLRGRVFDERDRFGNDMVTVVSETMVRKWFTQEDPLGQSITFNDPVNGPWMRIIGVVGDVHNEGPELDSYAQVYLPLQQNPLAGAAILIRAANDAQIIPAARSAINGIDRALPVFGIETLDDVMANAVALPRFNFQLISALALASLLLAAVGLYGVMAYLVAERSNEIGIRMALGAQQRDVLLQVVGKGALMVAIGTVVGITGAAFMSRLLSSMLFGIEHLDITTYGAVSVLLLIVAAVASFLPAWRASKMDPAITLRRE